VKRTHYVSFHNFFEQMHYTFNQQYDSFMYKYMSSKILRHRLTVSMKYHIITVKSYSSTDPMWSSSSMSSHLVNSLPHLISPWHAQKNVHDKWALTQLQCAVWQGLSEVHPQRNNPGISVGTSWTSDGIVRGITLLLASSQIQSIGWHQKVMDPAGDKTSKWLLRYIFVWHFLWMPHLLVGGTFVLVLRLCSSYRFFWTKPLHERQTCLLLPWHHNMWQWTWLPRSPHHL